MSFPPFSPGPQRCPALMLQGTASNVGKSVLVAGLCRLFHRRGLKVRPFKPQNMSNNASVTENGGEIARSTQLQSRACGLPATVDMNPVLLKPHGNGTAQVIVCGKIQHESVSGQDYLSLKPQLLHPVMESFERVCQDADLILVEGAGSPAEVNLRQHDIANMGFAEAANVPVLLVGDIDRGGVLASLVGTWELLTTSERSRLLGLVINRFRGDVRLFDTALPVLRDRIPQTPCLGVVPWLSALEDLPAEDSLSTPRHCAPASTSHPVVIAVPFLPSAANMDDLDPLRHHPAVRLEPLRLQQPLPIQADVVILPGSKSTLSDLELLIRSGWREDIIAHARRGGWVIGLCGGYQMLGNAIRDPVGLEGASAPRELRGLGLLPVTTELMPHKTTRCLRGVDLIYGTNISGYLMHTGITRSESSGLGEAIVRSSWEPAGSHGDPASSGLKQHRIWGSYWHGLFANADFLDHFLQDVQHVRSSNPHVSPSDQTQALSFPQTLSQEERIDTTLDLLATHLEQHLDIDTLWNRLIERNPSRLPWGKRHTATLWDS